MIRFVSFFYFHERYKSYYFSGFQKLIAGTAQATMGQRKLPFVVEKTIHNILFIKTHIQRQDEFDAVRTEFC